MNANRWASLLCVLASCLAGCHEQADGAGSSEAPAVHRFSGDYPIRIVTTTGMVADVAEHVGGAHVAVTALMGEGVDPHLYKASSGDVARLNQADMVVYSGLHLEGRMGDVLSRLARRKPAFAL